MNRCAFDIFIAGDLSKNRPGLWLIDPGGFGVRNIVIFFKDGNMRKLFRARD